MDNTALLPRNVKLFVTMSITALVGGYLYVMAMGEGYRAIIFIHGAILFFAIMAVFLRNVKTLFLFLMIFGLAFNYGFFLIYQPPANIEAPPFSMGIRLEATDVPLILLYIHWGLSAITYNGKTNKFTIGGKIGALFLSWICFLFISGFISATRINYSLYEGILYIKGFLFYLYLINNVRDEHDLKTMVYALTAGSVVEAAFMIFQFIMKKNYMLQGQYEIWVGSEGFRSVGFLSTPDACAIFLSTIFPIFLIGSFFVKNVFKKMLIGVSILLILVAVMFSQTRITAAVFGLGVVVSFVLSYRRGWISKGQILLASAATFFVGLAAIPIAYARFATGVYGEDRWPLIVTAWRIFRANFVFGIGPSNYAFVVDRYIPAELIGRWVFTVHNEYLLRLAETGIIGFLIFYIFLISVTIRFYHSTFSKNPLVFVVSCGLFSSTIGSYVHRLTSIYHIPLVFFLMCTVYSLSVIVGLVDQSAPSRAKEQELDNDSGNVQ